MEKTELEFLQDAKKEIEALLQDGVESTAQSMQAIAYKEWALGLSEKETIELIKKNTRNYAKRQITWFKQYKDAVIIDAEGKIPSEIAERIATEIK